MTKIRRIGDVLNGGGVERETQFASGGVIELPGVSSPHQVWQAARRRFWDDYNDCIVGSRNDGEESCRPLPPGGVSVTVEVDSAGREWITSLRIRPMRNSLAKLSAADEGSREIDLEIERDLWHLRHGARKMPKDLQITIPHYTTDLGAAISLVEADVEYEISTLHGVAFASVGLNLADGPEVGERKDGNVPLAVCIAAMALRYRDANGQG